MYKKDITIQSLYTEKCASVEKNAVSLERDIMESDSDDDDWEETFTMKSQIRLFSMCGMHDDVVSSKIFYARTFDDTLWRLDIHPRGTTEEDEEYVACFLVREKIDGGPNQLTVRMTMGLLDRDGIEQETRTIENTSFELEKKTKDGFERFIKRDVLLGNEVKDLLLPKDRLTIFCRIERVWPSDGPKHLIAMTAIECKIGKCLLEFPEFSTCTVNNKQSLTVKFETIWFHVRMYVLDDGKVDIEIRKIGESCEEMFKVSCTLSVVDGDYGADLDVSMTDFHCFTDKENDTIWNFPPFLSRKILGYVPDDVLKLNCEFKFPTCKPIDKIQKLTLSDPAAEDPEMVGVCLYRDMARLFETKEFHDVLLRVPESGDIIEAHNFIIADSSPVLKSMITAEHKGEFINVPGVKKNTLVEMLRYMYTDSVDENLDLSSLVDLFSASNKFEISMLKRRCSRVLKSRLNATNALVVLQAARKNLDPLLEESTVRFLAEYWQAVALSDEWIEFVRSNSKFATETRRKIRYRRLRI